MIEPTSETPADSNKSVQTNEAGEVPIAEQVTQTENPDTELLKKLILEFKALNPNAEVDVSINEGVALLLAKEWNRDYTELAYMTPAFRLLLLLFTKEMFFEKKLPMTFVNIDMDNLKAINDLYDHDGGNEAIKTYYLNLVARAQKHIKEKGREFYFVPYRLQAGGDELSGILFGDMDMEELSEIVTELAYKDYSKKHGKNMQINLRADYEAAQIHPNELAEQISDYEETLKYPAEKKKNFAELDALDKVNYLMELMQAKTDINLIDRKNSKLFDELRENEDKIRLAFIGESQNEEQLKKRTYERREALKQQYKELGSRRLSEMGMFYLANIMELYYDIIAKLERNEPLSVDERFKIGLASAEEQSVDHLRQAQHAANNADQPQQSTFEFPES